MPTTETIEQEEPSIEEVLNGWLNKLAQTAVEGEPFFNEGKFQFSFGSETDIYTVDIEKSINNIIQFPKKETKKLPPRI